MSRGGIVLLLAAVVAALGGMSTAARAEYVGTVTVTFSTPTIIAAGTEILGSGGGGGSFHYKGGGNAVDAAVAAALVNCIVKTDGCSLGGYGGHMVIWKAGWDGDPQFATCIDFGSTAGSLASSNMFAGKVDSTTGAWTGAQPPANEIGWKAAGVPGTFAGLYMAQTNYGRKVSGTNFFPFAEILKVPLACIANGQAEVNGYYSTASLSNLLMDLYTNSPGYVDSNGQPNPYSSNDPYGVFYRGDIARDIVAAMQTYGGLVTMADMTNYRPREVAPYMRHFNCPGGTPAWVCAAPLTASGVSVLEQIGMIEAVGWTNGPTGTWNSLQSWHSRAEASRLMWKDHFQWLGDPWSGVLPPDFLRNGSTNFGDQMLAHVTNGWPSACPSDPTEIKITNSFAATITNSVNNATNATILVHWNDIRYGTWNICTADKWGNCVAVTISMGDTYGAQVGVTNRGLVFGQGMSLFDLRPGWSNSIAPGKRQVDNMCPMIVIPDYPISPTNSVVGGRPPFAVGGSGGSAIEGCVAMELIKYLMDPPSGPVVDPTNCLYNFEANNVIYMVPSYPTGVSNYLQSVGYSVPGTSNETALLSSVQAWIPPVIVTQPAGSNVTSGATVTFTVTATGLPVFYQWYGDGVPLTDGATVSGSQTPQLTVGPVTNSAAYTVVVSNDADSITSAPADLIVDGQPAIVAQPVNCTSFVGTLATFSVTAAGPEPLGYRWRKGSVNLTDGGKVSGAATSQLTLSNVSFGDAGTYSVVVTNSSGSATSLGATLTVTNFLPSLSPIWQAAPGDPSYPYVTSSGVTGSPNERSIAYNALSNQLIVVQCPPSSTAYKVYVVDGTTGASLYTLNTNGVIHEGSSEVGGSNPIDLVSAAVADDGAVYICNSSPNSSGGNNGTTSKMFHLYRWANSGPSTAPVVVYQGDPSGRPAGTNERWGDAMAVRGSGTNTELILNSNDGLYGAVLKPTDSSMAHFTNYWFSDVSGSGTLSRSIQFGLDNTVFEKKKGTNLFLTTYYTNTQTSATQSSGSYSNTLGGVFVDSALNIAAGVDFIGVASLQQPDAVALYDISDPSAPAFIAEYNFPVSQVPNANSISKTVVAGWRVYAVDGNNGLLAFYINPPANSMILQLARSQTNVNLSWGNSSAVLQGTPGLDSPDWTDLTAPGQTSSVQPVAGLSHFYRLVLRR